MTNKCTLFFCIAYFFNGCGNHVLIGDTNEDDQESMGDSSDVTIDDEGGETDVSDANLDEIPDAAYETWSMIVDWGAREKSHALFELPGRGYSIMGVIDDGRGNAYIWILDVNFSGEILLQNSISGMEVFDTRTFLLSHDGHYILGAQIGESSPFENTDVSMLKFGGDGSIQIQLIYERSGNDRMGSILQASDEGYFILGSSESLVPGEFDLWAIKTLEDGSLEWQKAYDSGYQDWGQKALEARSGGYLVCGKGFGGDFWVIMLDPIGEIAWQKRVPAMYEDEALDALEATRGDFVVVARTESFGDIFDRNNTKIWILVIDGLGEARWQKLYDGPGEDVILTIRETSDGGYVAAGYTNSFGAGGLDALILKLDSAGSIQWQRTYGGENDDMASDVIEDLDGKYVVTGTTESFSSVLSSYWVMRMDASGVISSDCPHGLGLESFLSVETISPELEETHAVPQDSNAVISEASVSLGETESLSTRQCGR